MVVSVKNFGATGSGTTNDTQAINDAVNSGYKNIIIPEGNYMVDEDVIVLPDGVKLFGPGTLVNTATSTSPIGVHSKALIRVTTNNKVYDLNFTGQGNNVYGIGGFTDAGNECNNIIVQGITTHECGIFTAEPLQGFTFNRHDEPFVSWYENGQVLHKSNNIKVLDCAMFGDPTYTVSDNNFGSKCSGVTFLYTENSLAKNITVTNARFGAWSYGGASRNSSDTDITPIAPEAKNITFDNIIANDVFSPVWMSKTDNGAITGCHSNLWKDVAVDFEGCINSIGSGNIMTTDNPTTGGALTALNRCKNIIFANNIVKVSKSGANVLVRDGNDRIYYNNNRITSGTAGARVKVWNEITEIKNTNISISGNSLDEFGIEAQQTENLSAKQNTFHAAIGEPSMVQAVDSTGTTILNNVFRFDTEYTASGQANSIIQIVKGAGENTAYNTNVSGNQLLDVTGDTGILIFIDQADFNNIVIKDNIVTTVFVDDSFIHTPANGTKARVVWEGNYSPVSDGERTPASAIKRLNGGEKFSPTVLIGATGIGSLSGTYKTGDRIYRTNPTAGNTGWICVSGGTPGTWETF